MTCETPPPSPPPSTTMSSRGQSKGGAAVSASSQSKTVQQGHEQRYGLTLTPTIKKAHGHTRCMPSRMSPLERVKWTHSREKDWGFLNNVDMLRVPTSSIQDHALAGAAAPIDLAKAYLMLEAIRLSDRRE